MARILLLEPDHLLARTFCRALQAAGYAVDCCANAQAAIVAADTYRPDIVVMELQLVSHSGIEFLYEFRTYADWMTVPVIILTHVPPGEFGASRDVLMKELGVATYLYKPQTSLQKLVSSVNEHTAKV